MARTSTGTTLTVRHRQQQLAIRAEGLAQFQRLWPVWEGDTGSFDTLVAATVPLVQENRRRSSATAAGYYQAFRTVEEVPGEATPRLAPRADDGRITASLTATGVEQSRRAVNAGQAPRQAMNTTLVTMSGAVGRHVMDGGRETVVLSIEADPEGGEGRWQRVTGTKPCEFCIMLSSRGPAYLSDASADFQPHDHCGCTAEPVYPGGEWNPQNLEHRELWNEAQMWAIDNDELPSGTSNDLLNALRRYMNA